MNDLIKRIDFVKRVNESECVDGLLEDLRAEIQRLLTANEALKGLCEDYQAQIKEQRKYVPMTDDELFKLHTSKSAISRELMCDSRWVEAEVIKRAELEIVRKGGVP